jgi:ferrous iron transport protein B
MKRIALVGMPNVGKTALFNALTGSFQKVANFSGVTVERKTAGLVGAQDVEVVDLPGLYSLDIATLDEKVSRDYLTGKARGDAPQMFVVVLDATHLQKSLYLLLQLLELGHRPLLALTQIDQSRKRGQELDHRKLARLSECQVVPVSAVSGEGIEALVTAIHQQLSTDSHFSLRLPADHQKTIKAPGYVREKFRLIDQWLTEVVVTPLRPDTLTAHIDRWVLHPLWGVLILGLSLLFMFQALFTWAAPLQDGIEGLVGLLGSGVRTWGLPILAESLLVDGIIGGVGGVIVFLPQILLLFFFVQLLEDVGYLGRAAFLLDGYMRKLGLPGKAMIPFLSSHACAIPGVMATRILEDRRERLITMMVLPLTTCSARLPVFALLIAALLPEERVWGPFTWQGLSLFGLYWLAMVTALGVAWVMRKLTPHGAPSMLLMELPPYRWPKASHLGRSLLNKAKIFLGKAGKIILALSLVIWALVSFPRTEDGQLSQVENSYAATIGRFFTPVFAPLGFDWRINTALVPAFAAREVVVSALATVFAVEGEEGAQADGLTTVLAERYPPATLVALLIWFVYAPQCISTFAVIRRESGGWLAPGILMAYSLALAWLAARTAYWLLS